MLPLISVLIPVYEVEEYLDRCVQSVLAQTYENFEVVMVDDGSKDRSAEIASRMPRSMRISVSFAQNTQAFRTREMCFWKMQRANMFSFWIPTILLTRRRYKCCMTSL